MLVETCSLCPLSLRNCSEERFIHPLNQSPAEQMTHSTSTQNSQQKLPKVHQPPTVLYNLLCLILDQVDLTGSSSRILF